MDTSSGWRVAVELGSARKVCKHVVLARGGGEVKCSWSGFMAFLTRLGFGVKQS